MAAARISNCGSIRRPGVRVLHVASLRVHTDRPLDVALDGEVNDHLPGEFGVAGQAVRVASPPGCEESDD